MILAAHIEMASFAQSGTGGAAAAKTSEQPQQAFSESLSAFSKAIPDTDSTKDGSSKTASRKKPASEDAKSNNLVDQSVEAKSPVLSQFVVRPEQGVATQQAQATAADGVTPQLSSEDAVASTDGTTQMSAQPENVLQSATRPGKALPQTASIASGTGIQDVETPGVSLSDAGRSAGDLDAGGATSLEAGERSSEHPTVGAKSASDVSSSATVDEVGKGTASAFAESSVLTNQAVAMATLHGQTASAKTPGDGLAGTMDAGVSNFGIASKAEPTAEGNSAGNGGANEATNTVANAGPSDLSDATAQDSILNTFQKAASNAFRGTNSIPVQVAHGASAGAGTASGASNAPVNQAIPLAIAPHQIVPVTNADVSTGMANQPASVKRAGDGLAGTNRASVSNAEQSVTSAASGKTESKDSNKDSTSDATGSKKHAEITGEESSTQTGAQRTTPSADQSQSDASLRGQNAVPVQMNVANHPAAALIQAQGTVSAASMQGASQHAGVASVAARSPLASASVPDGVPQAAPAINTAKLISTMGQSEMRVGMRSEEFGNISISTTASKDAITAQISLDHGELAKIISTQLPEMQARLGSSQTVNVRIDMNSTATGQGADTSGSMANSSYDQSRGGGQQSRSAAASYISNNTVDSQLSPVVATATTGYVSGNTRIDIRV